MRKICLISLLIPTLVLATQWSSRTLCPGVNTVNDDYPVAIANNGDLYKKRSNGLLYLHSYTGSYTWSSTETTCNGLGTIGCATIKPDKKEGYIGDDYDIFPITSSDGINWTRGSAIPQWNRSPNYPTSVSCAWYGPNKWLYVAYDDSKLYGAPYPYDNPQVINLSNPLIRYVSVRPQTGDYLVVQGWNGSDRDLYETTGFGASWGSLTSISEINSGNSEYFPVLGVISQEHENLLLWSTAGSVGGNDIYYSTGDDTTAVESASIGRIKALYK